MELLTVLQCELLSSEFPVKITAACMCLAEGKFVNVGNEAHKGQLGRRTALPDYTSPSSRRQPKHQTQLCVTLPPRHCLKEGAPHVYHGR